MKIKLAFRSEEQAEDAQEYALQGGNGGEEGGRNHLNVQNFGHLNLLEQEYEFTSSDGPIGGMMVPPVPIHEDGDVFHVPFDLEGTMQGQNSNEEGWIEAEDDESEYEEGTGVSGRKRARRAMNLKSQQSHDSINFDLGMGMNVDSSVLAAVNMTLDSDAVGMGDGTQRMDQEEEEEWHAFDPEEEEEEEGEENMAHHEFDTTVETDVNVSRRTKDSDISDIELVRADESQGQISLVSGGLLTSNDLLLRFL